MERRQKAKDSRSFRFQTLLGITLLLSSGDCDCVLFLSWISLLLSLMNCDCVLFLCRISPCC